MGRSDPSSATASADGLAAGELKPPCARIGAQLRGVFTEPCAAPLPDGLASVFAALEAACAGARRGG